MKTAILVLTTAGLDMARRLRASRRENVIIYGPACVVGRCGEKPGHGPTFETEEPGVFGWVGPLRKVFPKFWEEFDAIVGIMALGIVVRLVGPLLSDKRNDPAVVVVDDAGTFAVSVLGGHKAGANLLAREIAISLGATAVITTASEARRWPAVDLIGKALGWKIERAENLTRVAAAVVRGETIAVFQDAGARDWWTPFGPWPEHFVRVDDLRSIQAETLLVISDRLIDMSLLPPHRTLIYRPPTLVAGIGCKRGTTREAIEAWVEAIFDDHELSLASLSAVATVTLKADEPGLIAFAESRGVPLVAFPPEPLADQPGIETPSERVRSKIGIPAVSEPAALREAGTEKLLVTKQIGPGVTVAVARRRENSSADDADKRR